MVKDAKNDSYAVIPVADYICGHLCLTMRGVDVGEAAKPIYVFVLRPMARQAFVIRAIECEDARTRSLLSGVCQFTQADFRDAGVFADARVAAHGQRPLTHGVFSNDVQLSTNSVTIAKELRRRVRHGVYW